MEITAVTSGIGLRSQFTYPHPARAASRIIAKKDVDGDNRLSASEIGENSRLIQKADTNSDSFVDQAELLTALQRRMQERADIHFEVTVNINIVKANLGNLLSGLLGNDSGGNLLGNLDGEVSTNTRERLISALAFNSLDNRGIPGTSNSLTGFSDSSNFISGLFNTGNDNRDLLFNLLVDGLKTPEEEANQIMNLLQSQTFSTVA